MLKIWGRKTSSNVQKVMWVVGELSLEHERLDVGGAFGGNDTPEYLAMNPNGLVPTVEDDGHILWESNTIVRYLCARYGLGTLCPEDLGERAQADKWMDWLYTTVMANWGVMFLGLVRTPPSKRNLPGIEAAVERLGGTYKMLDRHLADRDFVLGDELTMADVPLGMSLYRYFELGVERPAMPNLEAWYRRLQDRPAYVEHVMVSFESLRVTD